MSIFNTIRPVAHFIRSAICESIGIRKSIIGIFPLIILPYATVIAGSPDTNTTEIMTESSSTKNGTPVASKVTELQESYKFPVRGLAFSPNGKLLAIVSDHEFIRIFDWKKNVVVAKIEKAAGANDGLTKERIRFSPDGQLLVACHSQASNDVVIRIWNTKTWEVLQDISDPLYGGCSAIDFSLDGNVLLRATRRVVDKPGETLVAYSTNNWRRLWGISTLPFDPLTVALSPDGKFIALGGVLLNERNILERQIRIFDSKSQALIQQIKNTVDLSFGQIAWCAGENRLAAVGTRAWDIASSKYIGGPDTTMIFDITTGEQIYGDSTGNLGINTLRCTRDGKYLIKGNGTGRGNGTGVRIFDGKHAVLLQEIKGDIGSLAVTSDGRYLAIGSMGTTTIWKLN